MQKEKKEHVVMLTWPCRKLPLPGYESSGFVFDELYQNAKNSLMQDVLVSVNRENQIRPF